MTREDSPYPTIRTSEGLTDSAFLLSFVGGIMIVAGSFIGMGLAMIGRPLFWGTEGWMMGNYNMMGGFYSGLGYNYGMMTYGLESIGVISGVLVIGFAVLMKTNQAESKIYGILVLVFSITSLAGMGVLFIGALFSLVGGVLAIARS